MIKNKLRSFIQVFKRELGIIIKDKDILVVILLSPVLYAFFYGSFYMYKSESDVPVVVLDYDNSALSREFTRNVDAHKLVKITESVPDYAAAQDRIFSMQAQGALIIPEGFSNKIKSIQPADVKILLNTSRFLPSNDINIAVNEVSAQMRLNLRLDYYEKKGYNFGQVQGYIEPVREDIRPMFNTTESYGDFLIPAILILILQQTLLIGLSESVAKERENNTLHELYETANKSIWALISGKASFYLMLYSAYALFFLAVPFYLFKLIIVGNIFTLVTLTVLFLLAVVYVGIFVSSFFKRKIISLQIFVFTSYPVLFISGYVWPLQTMPTLIKVISYFSPATPYLNAFNRITKMGAGWEHIFPEFLHLLLLTVLGFIAARIRMKYLIMKELNVEVHSPVFNMFRKIKAVWQKA
jgi:ABC-2 type transport system permease protein